jgi:serine/threonine protein kinase
MSSASLAAGQQVGKYLLGRKLGQGGFGVVFLAEDTSLDREVALKFLNPEHTATPQILHRFLQEARSAAKIAHPGIVTVFECGQVNDEASPAHGAAYIAMERLDGESLTSRLARSGMLAASSAMEIGRQVAAAVDAAHRAGIVHRDLKPDNIFLVPDPAVVTGERVKVLDFGIAKLGHSTTNSMQTGSMMVFGTPRYMSPEQCKSAAHVDHRSDIYTLGCILFELVCGVPPFSGTAGELIGRHMFVEPPDVAALVPDTPPHLVALIAQMLAKEPDDRPQSMALIQRELESGGALAPGLAPTLAPHELSAPARPPTAPIRSLGVRPASVSDRSDRVDMRLANANPTTLHSAAGSSVIGPALRRRGWSTAVVVAAIAVVGGGAWWIGSHSHRGDDVEVAAKPADPPVPAVKPATAPTPVPPPATEPVAQPAAVPDPAPPAGSAAPKTLVKKTLSYGVLVVTTTPACTVAVDGGAAQRTPLRAPLPPGHHTVVLSAADLDYNETLAVDIRVGMTTSVARKLAKPAVAGQPPSPPPSGPPTQPTGSDKDATINPFAHKQ